MVVYTCERCQKKFNKKFDYNKHMNRKIPCKIINEEEKIDQKSDEKPYCDVCDKSFNRQDALTRHLNTQLHKSKVNNSMNAAIGKNNNNPIQIVGNHNKVINKNFYLISPFGEEEIEKLTTKDKIRIFSSDDNTIVMIIIKTNLNPLTPIYHNDGYTDLKSGYGLVYNGKSWENKSIKTIMDDLLNSKRKDLLKIYEEIKIYLSNDDNEDIENKLEDIDNNVEPKYDYQFKSKKNLIKNLKTQFFNNRHLVKKSIENSDKSVKMPSIKNKTKNILKDGMTIEELDKILTNNKKQKSLKINLKKELAVYVLNKLKDTFSEKYYQSLLDKINNAKDIITIDVITRLLSQTFCFGDKLSTSIIDEKIKTEAEINEICQVPSKAEELNF